MIIKRSFIIVLALMLSDGTLASMMGGDMMGGGMMGGGMGGDMMGGMNQQMMPSQQQQMPQTNPVAKQILTQPNLQNGIKTDQTQQQIQSGITQQSQIDPMTGMPQQQQDIDPITGLPKEPQTDALKQGLSSALSNPDVPTNDGPSPLIVQVSNPQDQTTPNSPKYAALLKKIGESFQLQMKIRQQRKDIGDPTNPTPLVAIIELLEQFKRLLASNIVLETADQKVLINSHKLIKEGFTRVLFLFKEVYGIDPSILSPTLTATFSHEQKLLEGEAPKERSIGKITLSLDLDNLTKIEQEHLALCTDYMKSLPSTSLYEGRNRRNELTSAIDNLSNTVSVYSNIDNNHTSDMLSLIRQVGAAQKLLSQGEDRLEDVAMTEARKDHERRDEEVKALTKSKNISPIPITPITPTVPQLATPQQLNDPQQQQLDPQQQQQMDMNGMSNYGGVSTGMGL